MYLLVLHSDTTSTQTSKKQKMESVLACKKIRIRKKTKGMHYKCFKTLFKVYIFILFMFIFLGSDITRAVRNERTQSNPVSSSSGDFERIRNTMKMLSQHSTRVDEEILKMKRNEKSMDERLKNMECSFGGGTNNILAEGNFIITTVID